ncbi:MAG TPA: hypothetical protein VKB53_10215, partial [Gammaproteobacteria bacterium]|nr:hypothetical protein [Gammaproteobacteria bacterium]
DDACTLKRRSHMAKSPNSFLGRPPTMHGGGCNEYDPIRRILINSHDLKRLSQASERVIEPF